MHITALNISNFRSLKKVSIRDIRPVSIFHGLNNSGKSNILAALDMILRGKVFVDAPQVAADTEKKEIERPAAFYAGRMNDFVDNFHLNSKKPITFAIEIAFDAGELEPWKKTIESIKSEAPARGEIPTKMLKLSDGHDKKLCITGEFRYVDDQSCDVFTSLVALNTNYILYRNTEGAKGIEYIPSLQGAMDIDKRVSCFEGITKLVTDSFQLLGTDRFVGREKFESTMAAAASIAPESFKQFLFALSTHRTKYDNFKKINQRFSQAPFKFGELSFFIDPKTHELEIMIERAGIRLPLGRMGAGLQQILYLIASILSGDKKIIAVEEIELNLSHRAQVDVFEMLKEMVLKNPKLIHQILVTSHSDYFQGRNDVKYYQVGFKVSSNETEVLAGTKKLLKTYFAN